MDFSGSLHEKEALFRALDDPFHPLEFKRKDIKSMNMLTHPLSCIE
jgi:hypothetical protein